MVLFNSGDGSLSASILFKYECRMGYLFVLSWASVLRVALGVLFWSVVRWVVWCL